MKFGERRAHRKSEFARDGAKNGGRPKQKGTYLKYAIFERTT